MFPVDQCKRDEVSNYELRPGAGRGTTSLTFFCPWLRCVPERNVGWPADLNRTLINLHVFVPTKRAVQKRTMAILIVRGNVYRFQKLILLYILSFIINFWAVCKY
jgi:hypothetical protein